MTETPEKQCSKCREFWPAPPGTPCCPICERVTDGELCADCKFHTEDEHAAGNVKWEDAS
jgi:predicted amidophosphoribosyltransferase